MPNTASAERRVRNSARRAERNQSTESRLKTLEKNYLQAVAGKNKEQAAATLRSASSALDKAVKVGVIHRRTADRKKSRLATKLATLK
jgi:small subunit ribosomal protein S20